MQDCYEKPYANNGQSGSMKMARKPRKFDEEKPPENHDIVKKRLAELSRANLTDLPDLPDDKTSISRTRLFVTNFPHTMNAEDFQKLFENHGKNSVYICPKKSYCLVTMDSYENALNALNRNGYKIEDKYLKVRFSNSATIKVENLCPYVSNELLYAAFSIFGDVESCFVNCNERGRSSETGVVEFKTKTTAINAVKRCQEKCFFLTATLKPVIAELCQISSKEKTLSESSMWKDGGYYTSRSLPPRFAKPGTIEHMYAQQWQDLYNCYKEKQAALEQEFKLEVEKLQIKVRTLENEEEIERLKVMLMEREMFVAESKKRCERLEKRDSCNFFQGNGQIKQENSDFGQNSVVGETERPTGSGARHDFYAAQDCDRRGCWDTNDDSNMESYDYNGERETKRPRYSYGYESC